MTIMAWWFNNYHQSYEVLAVMLNDLKRVNNHSVTQHTTDIQQADESGMCQNCKGDTGSYLRRTAHCGLLQFLEANFMTIPR
jgi:hypothetical protein